MAREYNSDLGVDHWTAVRIILSEIRICFSIMHVTKRFVVKSYVDASFDTDLDDSKSRSRYILKVGSVQSIVDIEFAKYIGSECDRPVD